MTVRKLLTKFHIPLLTDAECAAVEDYLFGTGVRPPLTDEGILNTVDYLKRICEFHDCRSVADVERFYANERLKAARMFENLRQQRDN